MTTPNAIAELKPIYFVNKHDIDREVFLPIVEIASSISCMSGYFTSGALSELACSLSHFLSAKGSPIRFIIGPNLEEQDLNALKIALDNGENLINLLFPGYELTEDNLRSRAVTALACLVATGRLTMKLGLQEQGLFHTKCWIFETEFGGIAIHGSVNATSNGLSVNTEQIGLSKEFESPAGEKGVDTIRETFELLWSGKYDGVETIEVNHKTIEYLCKIYEKNRGVSDWSSYLNTKILEEYGSSEVGDIKSKLTIPKWLNYQTGEYEHQGEAVNAWMNKGKGILSIATGGG